MILVFGGTTEGRAIAKLLDEMSQPYFYSTKTTLQNLNLRYGKAVHGGMNRKQMEYFCIANKINLILNGSHPFAQILHKTIGEVALELQIPVLRLERKFPERLDHDKLIYLNDYEEALDYLNQHSIQRLLALTGVQTIPHLKAYWSRYQCWFRILDRDESYQKAEEYGFPNRFLIGETPVDSIEYEMEMIQKFQPQAVLTKESGLSGYFLNKMEAAKRSGVTLLIIKRPELPVNFRCVYSLEELQKHLSLLNSTTLNCKS
ncbi:MAG: precorrin-6A/cobalt-precorrin-6A reductase [Marinifilaceae bacterium]